MDYFTAVASGGVSFVYPSFVTRWPAEMYVSNFFDQFDKVTFVQLIKIFTQPRLVQENSSVRTQKKCWQKRSMHNWIKCPFFSSAFAVHKIQLINHDNVTKIKKKDHTNSSAQFIRACYVIIISMEQTSL